MSLKDDLIELTEQMLDECMLDYDEHWQRASLFVLKRRSQCSDVKQLAELFMATNGDLSIERRMLDAAASRHDDDERYR